MKKISFILIFFIIFFLVSGKEVVAEYSLVPSWIMVPSAGIDLPVKTAQINYDTWEVSLDSASFGDSTALPGNSGNTVIFAHSLDPLFAQLPNVTRGDYVHVFTDKDWFVYEILETTVVNPEDIHILEPEDNHEVTLYTCVGEDYEKRFIAKGQLVSSPFQVN